MSIRFAAFFGQSDEFWHGIQVECDFRRLAQVQAAAHRRNPTRVRFVHGRRQNDNGNRKKRHHKTPSSAVPGADWPAGAAAILAAMGYRSELGLEGQTGVPSGFRSACFPLTTPARRRSGVSWTPPGRRGSSSRVTNAEIAEAAAPSQQMMFDADGFDTGNAQSFLFFAVELRDDSYSRGRYAEFTREINKRLFAPSVILFRTASGRVTLAFPHRRPNRRDATRDVLGRVSLVREIVAADPHRAHLDILAELSLPARLQWMTANGQPANFDGLLAAWLNALDTEELNRRFYRDLFQWFERAVETAKFPASGTGTLSPEEHVIRLITRLMFVWFIKEKGLAADELFHRDPGCRVAQGLRPRFRRFLLPRRAAKPVLRHSEHRNRST